MTIQRRQFIQTMAGVLGLAALPAFRQKGMTSVPLAFSTLGCPDWSFDEILDFAAANDYSGIEIRGILREMNLPQSALFKDPRQIELTRRQVADRGLKLVNLGASAELHHSDAQERAKQLKGAKQFIDLAHRLGCPYVRVFPNKLDADNKAKSLDTISSALRELGEFARGSSVKVLMETHGDLVHPDDLLWVMQAAGEGDTGLVWDICNMWTVTRQSPVEVYQKIKPYVFHTHIKDIRLSGAAPLYVVPGQGDCPIFPAIDALLANNYQGFYSFEWEKLWHPEIDAPEIALAVFPKAMKAHLG